MYRGFGVGQFARMTDEPVFLQSALPIARTGEVPEMIHVLPAGPRVETNDGRGPYLLDDLHAIVEASFAQTGRLSVDENHATYLAAPKGGPSPAFGWIPSMEVRDNGIWARVDWNARGRAAMRRGDYIGISPALARDPKTKAVIAIRNVSLTNRPNLRGMATLHHEEEPSMDRLIEALGLQAGATEDEMLAAIEALKGGGEVGAALQSQMAEIGVALGLPQDAAPATVVSTAKQAKRVPDAENIALQARIEALEAGNRRAASERFVDEAIAGLTYIPAALRDQIVELHMADPARAKETVAGLPNLGRTSTDHKPPAAKGEGIELNADQRAFAAQLGVTPEEFAAELRRQKEEAA
jgi:phage I-like protein